MKVLWILNTPLPEALGILTGKPEDSHSTGSWVCALAAAMAEVESVQLAIAAPSPLVEQMQVIDGQRHKHIIFPTGKADWKSIESMVSPEVVHIHGTEYPLGLEYVKACGSKHVVASLQGMISAIGDAYWAGMTPAQVKGSTSMRDIIRKDTMQDKHDSLVARGKAEEELLKAIHNVMGRTDWDRSTSLSINPSLHYHHCDELMREAFHTGCWVYGACKPHSIFMSQGYYPLKGMHKVLEALPLILKAYPDATVRVAGINIIRGYDIKSRLLRSGYGKFLAGIISRHGLRGHVKFVGELNAEQMKDELMHANVFLSASSIENSPNSLCEAQMLGVPSVASNVGGTSTLIPTANCGTLYQFGDREGLAEAICKTFESSSTFDNYEMRETATSRHNTTSVIKQLLSIYEEIAAQ